MTARKKLRAPGEGFTDEERRTMLKLHREGDSYVDLARYYKCSVQTIKTNIAVAGIERRIYWQMSEDQRKSRAFKVAMAQQKWHYPITTGAKGRAASKKAVNACVVGAITAIKNAAPLIEADGGNAVDVQGLADLLHVVRCAEGVLQRATKDDLAQAVELEESLYAVR